MEPEETATVVRLVKSLFPQQPIDRATYDTWHLVLGELDFGVAQAAVIAIAHSEKFCAASDIVAEATRARRRHPSERTVAEALGQPAVPAIGAARTEPTPEYLAAKADWDRKQRERAQEVQFADRAASRRAELWLSYKLTGKLPPALPLSGPPAPQWQPLPGDPPELLAWLAHQGSGPN